MGMHKLEYCKKNLHLLKGFNAVEKADGTRACRLCRAETRRKARAKKKIETRELEKKVNDFARY